MTDILVRVPVGETEHFWRDYGATAVDVEWWTLGTRPTQFLKGDWVFFALKNEVVAYAAGGWVFDHAAERFRGPGGGAILSDDGRLWTGHHIVWPAAEFKKLDRPIPLTEIGLQVPRGFAYCGHTPLRTKVLG